MFGFFASLLGLAGWKVTDNIIHDKKKEEAAQKYGVYNSICKNDRSLQQSVFIKYCVHPRVPEAEYKTRKELYEMAKKELKNQGYDWNANWDKEMSESFVPDDQLTFEVGKKITYFEKRKRRSGIYEGYAPLIQDTIIGMFFDDDDFARYMRMESNYDGFAGSENYAKSLIKKDEGEGEFITIRSVYYFAPLFWNKNLKECYEIIVYAYDSLYNYYNGAIDKSSLSVQEESLLKFLLDVIKMTDESSPFFDDNPIDRLGCPLKWYREEDVENIISNFSVLYVPFPWASVTDEAVDECTQYILKQNKDIMKSFWRENVKNINWSKHGRYNYDRVVTNVGRGIKCQAFAVDNAVSDIFVNQFSVYRTYYEALRYYNSHVFKQIEYNIKDYTV